MPVRMPTPRPAPQRSEGQGFTGLILAIAGLLASGAVLAWSLPPALVLPGLSVLVLLSATAAAVIGWLRPCRPRTDRVNYWDVAGALTLIGVCAALLSDVEQVMPLLEARRSQ
jgi:hypothetical protein